MIHEQTFAGKNQLEMDVPVNYARPESQLDGGVGDITLGMKRELFSSERTGSILSVQGGILLPTGDSKRGFGAGTTQFEPFAAYRPADSQNRTFCRCSWERTCRWTRALRRAACSSARRWGGDRSGPWAGPVVFADGGVSREA